MILYYSMWPEYVKDRIRTTYMYFGGSVLVTAASALACFRSPLIMSAVMGNSWLVNVKFGTECYVKIFIIQCISIGGVGKHSSYDRNRHDRSQYSIPTRSRFETSGLGSPLCRHRCRHCPYVLLRWTTASACCDVKLLF